MPINEPDIRIRIRNLFGIDYHSLTLYRILPRGYPLPEAPVILDKRGANVSREELAALIGLQLPGLPDNQELRAKVIELTGGAEERYETRRVFEAVPVSDLPPPHNPYQCANRARFEDIRRRRIIHDRRDQQEVGRQFTDSLTADEVATCRYHRADWETIANESVRVVEAVGRLKTRNDYLSEARRGALGGQEEKLGSDLRWLVSLFEKPVIISGGVYTDGQHRGCALRFSGAPRAAVVTGSARVALPALNDWRYEGAG